MNLTEKLNELKAVCDAATSGQWVVLTPRQKKRKPFIGVKFNKVHPGDLDLVASSHMIARSPHVLFDENWDMDSVFISISRTAMPQLIEATGVADSALEEAHQGITDIIRCTGGCFICVARARIARILEVKE